MFGIGISFASFLRFWAVAASRNSSHAPVAVRGDEPIKFEDAFEVSKQHLDLFAQSS